MNPIIVLISSYKEGSLIQGAIRSAFTCDPLGIFIFDGKQDQGEIPGEDTNIGIFEQYEGVHFWRHRDFELESKKRTSLFHKAMEIVEKPCWVMTLDADEILVWGEYLSDWLGQLYPGYPESGENVVPLKRTEAHWAETGGFHTDIAPSRLIHSSLISRYLVSCWQIQTPDGKQIGLGHWQAERQPLYGEPHIHHRAYLRRYARADIRAHEGEEEAYLENLRPVAKSLETIPDEIERAIHEKE